MARKKQPKVVKKRPKVVEDHIQRVIKGTDWDAMAAILGQPCKGCPAKADPADDAAPACYSCPIWGLLLDLAQLRLLRRLEDGSSSGVSDKA